MSSNITKADLNDTIANGTGLTRANVDAVLTALGKILREAAADGLNVLTPFGRFKPVHRKARTGRNPRSGETIQIAAKTEIVFQARDAA